MRRGHMEELYKEELAGIFDPEPGEDAAGEAWEEETAAEEQEEPREMGSLSTEGEGSFDFVDSPLEQYRMREQDGRLAADRESGPAYRQLRDEVLKVMDYCHKTGHPEVDVQAAFQAVAGRNLGRICARAREEARREAVQKTWANERATPGPLGSGGGRENLSFEHMSDKEFERYLEMAYRGELKSRDF
jgi:hypothetical protein